MAKNAVQRGNALHLIAPAGGVTSGMGYIIGSMFVVALTTAVAGDEFEAATILVWDLPKASADTATQLQAAYWDDSNDVVTTSSSGNRLIGAFTEARGNGTTMAYVRLNGIAVA